MTDTDSNLRLRVQQTGLVAAPALALITYALLPAAFCDPVGNAVTFSDPGRRTLAIMVWMAVWWVTEAVHLSVTALLPLVAFPGSGAFAGVRLAGAFAGVRLGFRFSIG